MIPPRSPRIRNTPAESVRRTVESVPIRTVAPTSGLPISLSSTWPCRVTCADAQDAHETTIMKAASMVLLTGAPLAGVVIEGRMKCRASPMLNPEVCRAVTSRRRAWTKGVGNAAVVHSEGPSLPCSLSTKEAAYARSEVGVDRMLSHHAARGAGRRGPRTCHRTNGGSAGWRQRHRFEYEYWRGP